MHRKTNVTIFAGTIAMGLIVAWINAMPLYGPLLVALNIKGPFYPFIFTISHVFSLICSSWCLLYRPSGYCGKRFMVALPFVVAFLTVSVVFFQNLLGVVGWTVFFVITGILTGLIVCRWMAWFSSDLTKNLRGSVFGKTIAITYILISLITIILFQLSQGLTFTLIIIASMILFGGLIAGSLPVPKNKPKIFDLKKIIPPRRLMLFALFGYSTMALAAELVTFQTSKQPLIIWLLPALYFLIGFVLSPYIDRHGRYYFFILAFFCSGLAFLLVMIAADTIILSIAFALLINSALIFIHLYYWLSLVEHQNARYAPLPLAIGISFELFVFSAAYYLASLIPNDPLPAQVVTGIAGVVLIILGFSVLSGYTEKAYQLMQSKNELSGLDDSEYSMSAKGKSQARIFLSYQVFNMGKEIFLSKLKPDMKFTKKEQDIVYLIATGFANNEIVEEILISVNTLKFHIKNIYMKLDVSNRNEAINKLINMVCTDTQHPE